MPVAAEFALLVKQAALEAGFDLAGVAAARAYPELDHFPEFLASGRSGEMGYLESRTAEGRLKRSAVETAFPWARSVIVCAVNYNAAQPYSTAVSDPARGWVARYAWTPEDYHRSVLRKLKAVEQQVRSRIIAEGYRSFTDFADSQKAIVDVLLGYRGIGD